MRAGRLPLPDSAQANRSQGPSFEERPRYRFDQGVPARTGSYHHSLTKEEAERLLEAIGGTPGPPPSEPEPEEGFEKGGKRSAASTLRNPKLREEAKRKYGLNCYCCGFKFEDFYGPRAKGRAIVHHLETFRGDASKQRVSTVDDVRVVCANCHYVIHLTEDPLDVDDLKRMIEQSWTRWDQGGVSRTVSLARSRGARPALG